MPDNFSDPESIQEENSFTTQPENHTEANSSNILIESDHEVFDGIPEEQARKIIQTVIMTFERSHSGPLPSPDSLRKYSEIIPNGADRIMKMAEKQLDHRMEMEKKVLRSQLIQSNVGQFLAFAIGISALLVSGYCILHGHEISGSVIGAGGLIGLVTAFIQGRRNQEKEQEEE